MDADRILIVDDDIGVRRLLEIALRNSGFEPHAAENGEAALDLARDIKFAVAIVDLVMPGIDGMETAARLRECDPDIELIIYTGNPSFDTTLSAIQRGAFEYLCKPSDLNTVIESVRRAAERARESVNRRESQEQIQRECELLRRQVQAVTRAIETQIGRSASFVGTSRAAQAVRHFAALHGPTNQALTILGPPGAGKDAAARLIHEASGRDPGGFVKIRCAGGSEFPLEGSIFGFASTAGGNGEARLGLLDFAANGKAYFDEVAALPLDMQETLYRFIRDGEFVRAGGGERVALSARVIVSSRMPLAALAATGRFHPGLWEELKPHALVIPPLKERVEDIPLLFDHLLERSGARKNHPGLQVGEEARRRMIEHDWPGNAADLAKVARRMAFEGSETAIADFLDEAGRGPNAQGA